MGNCAADLDTDGALDVVFANQQDGVKFEIDSRVYWGSPAGFSAGDTTGLPTVGAYCCSIPGSPLDAASSAYGTQPSEYGSFKVWLHKGKVMAGLWDRNGRAFEVSAPQPDNVWTHATASYDAKAGTIALYLNGKLAASKADPKMTMGKTWPWQVRVGSDAENQKKMLGLIDEVRVYDRAVSAGEAAALFTGCDLDTDDGNKVYP
jgi:hypothetical protein